MHLRVSDQRYALQYDQHDDHALTYEDVDTNIDSNLIVVDPYVCLFDDDWKIVDEVWEYLQYLLHVKKLSFSTVITKGSDLKLFYEFLQQHKIKHRATTQKTIHDFNAWLSHCDLQPLNRIISSMKNFYQYHHQQNGLSTPFDTSTPSSHPAPSNGRTNNTPIHQQVFIVGINRRSAYATKRRKLINRYLCTSGCFELSDSLFELFACL